MEQSPVLGLMLRPINLELLVCDAEKRQRRKPKPTTAPSAVSAVFVPFRNQCKWLNIQVFNPGQNQSMNFLQHLCPQKCFHRCFLCLELALKLNLLMWSLKALFFLVFCLWKREVTSDVGENRLYSLPQQLSEAVCGTEWWQWWHCGGTARALLCGVSTWQPGWAFERKIVFSVF